MVVLVIEAGGWGLSLSDDAGRWWSHQSLMLGGGGHHCCHHRLAMVVEGWLLHWLSPSDDAGRWGVG